MSAYIVERNHIRFLVHAAIAFMPNSNEVNSPTALGRMLWRENIKSVKNRYPKDCLDDLPGPVTESYDYHHEYVMESYVLRPVEVIKAVYCYEYQSCEHDGWPESKAKEFCNSLVKEAICELSEYERAEWGVPAAFPS